MNTTRRWEIFSSMYDGRRNKKSGILVINARIHGRSDHQRAEIPRCSV